MQKVLFSVILQSLTLFVFSPAVFPQDCKPPEIVFNKNADNIFTEEQEVMLGEVISEQVQKDYRIISDTEVNRIVRNIGAKLTKHLPPTNIDFKFYVVDLPEINAFAAPGGRIYITRKLIAFVRSEDELAGIIAHELGHGIVRHGTTDMSRYFKKIIGVNQVGDKKDIFEKYNKLIDLSRTKRIFVSQNHENDQQLEADKIGVFAMTAAGYDPNAFTSTFDRLADTKGKTGNWLSDVLGGTTASQKRLKEIIVAVKTIPASCLDKNSSASAKDFEEWQTKVISYSNYSGKEQIGEVLRRSSLNPDFRDDISYLKFSRDGRYLLAQDDSGIFVLQKDPFKFLFRIEAPEAKNAKFSPDSSSVVFDTETMRVEKWSIAEQKPTLIKEIFINDRCFQTALSDDGKMFACFSIVTRERSSNRGLEVKIKLLNVETNETLFEKENFYRPDPFEFVISYNIMNILDDAAYNIFQTEFSPDGRYFLVGRGLKYARQNYLIAPGLEGRASVKAGNAGTLGYDLVKNEEIKIGTTLSNVIASPFAFYSNDKIVGQHREDEEKSGIFEFPSGKQIEKFALRGDSLTKAFKGNYVLVRPLKVAPVGVYDLDQKKFVVANNTSAFDVYDNVFVSENKTGILGLYRLDKDETVAEIELPKSRFGNLRVVSLSPDFNWIAVSDKNRGAVWSLYSGKRYHYVKGFRGAFFDKDGKVYADFAKSDKIKRQVAAMNLRSEEMIPVMDVETPNTRQFGKYLYTIVGKNPPKKKDDEDKKPEYMNEYADDYRVEKDGTIEFKDIRTGNTLWSRKFSDEMPQFNFNPVKETISLRWALRSSAAKEIIKGDEKLRKLSAEMGDKDGDYLVQVIEAETGNVLGQTLVETGEGSFRIRTVLADGDWLSVSDNQNRVLLYSLSSGELKHRFFGGDVTISSESNLAAIENFAGQISIYDLTTGEKINEMNFKAPVVLARFDKYGKKLFVLTSDQEAIIFETAKFVKAENIAVH